MADTKTYTQAEITAGRFPADARFRLVGPVKAKGKIPPRLSEAERATLSTAALYAYYKARAAVDDPLFAASVLAERHPDLSAHFATLAETAQRTGKLDRPAYLRLQAEVRRRELPVIEGEPIRVWPLWEVPPQTAIHGNAIPAYQVRSRYQPYSNARLIDGGSFPTRTVRCPNGREALELVEEPGTHITIGCSLHSQSSSGWAFGLPCLGNEETPEGLLNERALFRPADRL